MYVFVLLLATACSSSKTVADNRAISPDSYYTTAASQDQTHCAERLTMSGGISVKCN